MGGATMFSFLYSAGIEYLYIKLLLSLPDTTVVRIRKLLCCVLNREFDVTEKLSRSSKATLNSCQLLEAALLNHRITLIALQPG
jgi:hypothetical protein